MTILLEARMPYNAYILDWTMNDYDGLKQKLKEAGFPFRKERGKEHIRAAVPFDRVEEFFRLTKSHLNTPYNYVDIQFPSEKKTALVFSERLIMVSNSQENEAAQRWAIARGLPPEQADWKTSY